MHFEFSAYYNIIILVPGLAKAIVPKYIWRDIAYLNLLDMTNYLYSLLKL